jgi:hypothetical protein
MLEVESSKNRVNGEYDFAANSNLRESFRNLNEDMENIGG